MGIFDRDDAVWGVLGIGFLGINALASAVKKSKEKKAVVQDVVYADYSNMWNQNSTPFCNQNYSSYQYSQGGMYSGEYYENTQNYYDAESRKIQDEIDELDREIAKYEESVKVTKEDEENGKEYDDESHANYSGENLKIAFCSYCGAKVRNDKSIFCAACGKRL